MSIINVIFNYNLLKIM